MGISQVFILLLSNKYPAGLGVSFFKISLFPFSFPYCWHLIRDLWASLGCVSESDNWISQGASYQEDRFVLLCGTPLVADLLGVLLPEHRTLTQTESQLKASHQSIREWESTGQSTHQKFRIMTSWLSLACSTLGEVSLLSHALLIQIDLRERCRNVSSVFCKCVNQSCLSPSV